LFKSAAAAAVGIATVSFFNMRRALAAGTPPDQQPSFQAIGPAPDSGTAFDATATSSGAPIFTNGIQAMGSAYGVKGFGPSGGVYGAGAGVGARGASTSNGVGVLGISFTDATQSIHGDGVGVQGDSGSGYGVAGYSQSRSGVYGQSGAGVGVTGEGPIGVQGFGSSGIGIKASNNSKENAAIYATNEGPGSAIEGASGTGRGVLGTSGANSGPLGLGSGVVGSNINGTGAGVAGYSLISQKETDHLPPPAGTGVFGLAETYGVAGEGPGIGVRGAGFKGGTGVLGESYEDRSQTTPGAGIGVQGNSGSRFGVAGFSQSGIGVYGRSNKVGVSGEGPTGVLGLTGEGVGVSGDAASGTGVRGNAAGGTGVMARNKSTNHAALLAANEGSGEAIQGISARGYGAELQGGRAALRLVPLGTQGHPTSGSHQAGELIMDAAGKMFVCVHPGRPGLWRQLKLE